MKKLLPLLIPLLALAAGIAAGDMLRPAAEPTDHAAAHLAAEDPDAAGDDPVAGNAAGHGAPETAHAPGGTVAAASAAGWFTFPTQFFVPLMRNGDMGAIMILTLTIETGEADLSAMEHQEHRLRDALLRELMIHANTGGFDGNFTSEARLAPLRERLQRAAQASTDLTVKAVLIEDIARQAG